MIELKSKSDCCGCSACVQKCPKQCIAMEEDEEGFLYPIIDKETCIDCGLCEKVCPVINQYPKMSFDPKVYACKNKNEDIRSKSSSGGLFTLFAEQALTESGVVFGARFSNDWAVVHDYTEAVEGLAAFRGSKYVQSVIGDNYIKAEQFLKAGRKVLFSGTSCQIHGLHRYLRKEYDNLITVEILCHGAPSPGVFKRYLGEVIKDKITDIQFRDKTNGWRQYQFVVKEQVNQNSKKETIRQTVPQNTFMLGFLSDLYLRPSCHACPSKSLSSKSDLTLADYWGIENIDPVFDDNKGVSLLLVNSNKGEEIFGLIKSTIDYFESTFEDALRGNPSLVKSALPHKKRDLFFDKYNEMGELTSVIRSITKKSFASKVYSLIRRILSKLKRLIVKL